MTLHLTYVGPRFIVTVGDRRLTVSNDGTITEFDAYANKSVVVLGIGCAVVVSYTGLAHIDGASTANWIAEQVMARKLPESRLLGEGNPIEFAPQEVPHLGEIIARLCRALERDLPRQQVRDRHVEVSIAGYVSKRHWRVAPSDPRNSRPIFLSLKHRGERRRKTKVQTFPKMWGEPSRFKIYRIGTRVPDGIQDELAEALCASGGQTLDAVETLLVEAVRKTSRVCSTVGTDCMTIHLVPVDRRMHIMFDRDPSRTVAAFTPVIAGADLLAPPAIMRGSTFPQLASGAWSIGLGVHPPLPTPLRHLNGPPIPVFEMGAHPQKPFMS
ncbi:hypothetical protein [Isoptericola sp. NPDC056134]|uniref:hypothetical protein n=1 Tax=Isoptericola sp. NPDC056134 TaxID=3345723 RepID=UPI0035E4E49D